MTSRDQYTFFWRAENPFSQWHYASFSADDVEFNCAEQYMMYHKALLFKDSATAREILEADHPKTQKALGRKVVGFTDDLWKKHREDIVYQGNYHKFTQNPELKKILLATAGKTLVEASPYDRIWGIGLKEGDPRAMDPNQWRGMNLLGQILTRLRDDLLSSPNEG